MKKFWATGGSMSAVEVGVLMPIKVISKCPAKLVISLKIRVSLPSLTEINNNVGFILLAEIAHTRH